MVVGDVHPKQTQLAQNFPNPFNPETWMPFQLSQSSAAVIQIYDVSGRLVRTLDLGDQTDWFLHDTLHSRILEWAQRCR